jgi:ribosomal-protein-alanine N-acetyltransferase
MNHIGTKNIETNKLILRKFEITDSENMFKNWGSDSNVTKYLSWKTHMNIKDSEEIINLWISNYDDNSVYNWVIELKEINEAIGNISVVKLENTNKSCEIGYCIGSKYWNKGITTEAFQNVIDYLFKEVGINRICAKHNIENIASGEVMKKCKMSYEGTLREVQFRNDRFCSLAVYSILKSEWENIF